MRTLQKSRNKKLFGVAAGLAEYFEMDVTLMRALCIGAFIIMPPTFLAYLALAIALPTAPYQAPVIEVEEPSQRKYRRMTKSCDRWVSGVCGGIAEYFEIDPIIVRALFLASLFAGGVGFVAYLILSVIMPRPAFQYGHR